MAVVADVQYADHFWGEKHHGYQVLYDNLKKGDEVVNEFSQFVKERMTVEDDYVKSINRSANKITNYINNGSNIEPMWVLAKGTLELLSEIHLMVVRNMQDLSRDVLKYKDEIGRSRKEMKQQNVADAVNLMQTTTTCLQKAKETYHSRCAEFEKARKETPNNPKDIAKLEVKLARAREEYKSYIDKYETVRSDFEEKLTEACIKFQAYDKSVYTCLQHFMLFYARHMQEMSQATQQVTAQFRESLQQLNSETFFKRFVAMKGTGQERPPRVAFEEAEGMTFSNSESSARDIADLISANSLPSSCSSSGVVQQTESQANTRSFVDLLMMDVGENAPANVVTKPSPTAPADASASEKVEKKLSLVQSGSIKKLPLFMPKKRKTISQSSIDEQSESQSAGAGSIFKFSLDKRRSRKSTDCDVNLRTSFCADDAQSTASSSKSDDKQLEAPNDLLKTPRKVDEEGFTIRDESSVNNETNWLSCSSSDEEDENELQQSKIRALTIRPADKAVHMNASVDELRDAIGHISLTRSTTFDKSPWTIGGSRAPPLFSQSMSAATLKQPLRSHHTADGRFRTSFNESDYSESNVPPSFSVSMGHSGLAMARARPRSNTPTHNQFFSSSSLSFTNNGRKESTSAFGDAWSSSFNNLVPSESSNSLGESSFNISQSTGNLLQATISEQRIPVAMAINEFSHVWFKSANPTQNVQRIFGTVMISFASSSIPLLASTQNEFEPLQFCLRNTENVKTVLPNKQLVDESLTTNSEDETNFTFNRQSLIRWLQSQKEQRPNLTFYNAEVARYELIPNAPQSPQPPLMFTAYWKFEPTHTDIRVDYRLNTDSCIITPMLNVVFTTVVNGEVESVTSDPAANWSQENSTISWTVHEISRYGDVGGSLKARLAIKGSEEEISLGMIERKASQVYAQFQCHEANISGVDVSLGSSDLYHLSMVKKKVLAGKYFCDPELRK